MRISYLLLAAAVASTLPCEVRGADERQAQAETAWVHDADPFVFTDGRAHEPYEPMFLTRGQTANSDPNIAVRFGWWGADNDGSEVKTGEYQDLDPSPFFDVDGLLSDGFRTVDFFATGTDNESTQAEIYMYRPGASAEVGYQRFPHRLDHKPLYGYQRFPGSDAVATDDLNVGEDYAIRVQEVDARFKGRITDNIKWELNVFSLQKNGERQVNATQHCYNFSQCHVGSQRQRIDWTTTQVEPVLKGKFGGLSVEYSRTMRQFNEGDEVSQRLWDHFGSFENPAGLYDYAVVPETLTQIDRLKVGFNVGPQTDFYGLMHYGNTANQLRDTNRSFGGFDVRLTNQSIRGVKVTGFAKYYKEDQTVPSYFLADQREPIDGLMELGGIRFGDVRFPIDRERTKAGVKARWRPFNDNYSLGGLSFTGGYEFSKQSRTEVAYVMGDTDFPTRPPLDPDQVFVMPDTVSHLFQVGLQKRWSSRLDSYLRYKARFTDDPLLGLRLTDENYPNDLSTFSNTSLPENDHRVEIGGTWTPADNFLMAACFTIQQRSTSSEHANFDEDDYPIVVSMWYAPVPKWSFSAGYARFTNDIDQDITIGFRDPAAGNPAFTERWSYGGTANVVDLGSAYMCTNRLTLRGNVQYVHGEDGFDAFTAPAGQDWSALPGLTNVVVETVRLNVGVDFAIRQGVSSYLRYVYYDYEDETVAYNSGTSNMVLGGLTAMF